MIDGYKLFEEIRYGEPYTLRKAGKNYRFQFKGEHVGHSSSLEVTEDDTNTRIYRPGFDTPSVFAALDEIDHGWHHPQRYVTHKYSYLETEND